MRAKTTAVRRRPGIGGQGHSRGGSQHDAEVARSFRTLLGPGPALLCSISLYGFGVARQLPGMTGFESPGECFHILPSATFCPVAQSVSREGWDDASCPPPAASPCRQVCWRCTARFQLGRREGAGAWRSPTRAVGTQLCVHLRATLSRLTHRKPATVPGKGSDPVSVPAESDTVSTSVDVRLASFMSIS